MTALPERRRAGRYPNRFLFKLEGAVHTPQALGALTRVLTDSEHRHFASVWATVLRHIAPQLLKIEDGRDRPSVVIVLPDNGRAMMPSAEDWIRIRAADATADAEDAALDAEGERALAELDAGD